MQRRLKERLIGAAVLVMLAVIFIPMLLDNSTQKETEITETNIPPRPDTRFSSRIKPVTDPSISRPEIAPAKASETGITEALQGSVPDVQPESKVVSGSPAPPAAVPPVTPASQQPDEELPKTIAEQPKTGNGGLNAWVVQIGSFTSEVNAKSLHDQARSLGFTSFVEPLQQEGAMAYRVRVGPELTRSEAVTLAARLKNSLHVEGIVMQYP
jgi:DedD protein